MKRLTTFTIIGLAFLIASCDPGSDHTIAGHYAGTLTTNYNGQFKQVPIQTDIPAELDHLTSPILLKDIEGQLHLTITLRSYSENSVSLKISEPNSTQDTLNTSLVLTSGCFESGAAGSLNGSAQTTLCISSQQVSLEMKNVAGLDVLTIKMSRFDPSDAKVTEETPQVYTLSQAIERARKMNFNTRIEFEHVIQAKMTAKYSYLNLLPKITTGTIANNLPATWQSLLSSIDDVAPFLLPDRWLDAKEAEYEARAEVNTLTVMKLDTAQEVEGLVYTYDQDKTVQGLYTKTLVKVSDLRNQVSIREKIGQLPDGSTAAVDAIVAGIQQNTVVMDQILTEDRTALGQAMGFLNPLAVQDMHIDVEIAPIGQVPTVDYPTLNSIALSRSFEIQQIDNLTLAAKDEKEKKYFSWLDPAADPPYELGFGLGSQIELSKSQIRELGIDREQLQSTISQRAQNAVMEYQQTQKAYELDSKQVKSAEELIDTASTNLQIGAKVDLINFITLFQTYLSAAIQQQNDQTAYRIAKSKIDRLQLVGFYTDPMADPQSIKH
jgi:outer membrane protein TolC